MIADDRMTEARVQSQRWRKAVPLFFNLMQVLGREKSARPQQTIF
jgi:hypothetical protein